MIRRGFTPCCRLAQRLLVLASTGLLLLAAASCAGQQRSLGAGPQPQGITGSPAGSPAAQPKLDLPAPRTLLPDSAPARNAAYLPEDLVKEGDANNPALPSRNVTAASGQLDFAPSYVSGGSISGLAYATYSFKLEDYDLNNEVRLFWAAPPAAGTSWVGLANWDSNRWDWFSTDSSGRAFPPSLAPYLDFGGDLLLIALRSGADPSSLDQLRVGTQPPLAVLSTNSRRYDFGSLDVDLDASASADPDGSITGYEWDFEGDGVFDAQSPDNPLISHQYDTPGSFQATVRVTDDKDISTTASLGVSVGGPWEHTVGLPLWDLYYDVEVAPDGTIWACGLAQNPEGINSSDLALAHFAANGEILKTSYWRSFNFNSQIGSALCIGPDGAVYVGGTGYTNTFQHVLFQRYSSEGELQWSHAAPDFLADVKDMMVLNGTVYAIGSDNDGDRERGTVFTFPAHNFNNIPLSMRLPKETTLTAMTYFPGSEVEPAAILAVGGIGVNSDADLLYVSFSPALQINDDRKWAAVGGSQLGRAIAVTGTAPDYSILVGAYRGTSPTESCVLRLGVNKGYNLQGAKSVNIMDMWPSGTDDSVYVLALESSSVLEPDQLRLTRLDSLLNPLAHYVFASGIATMGISGLHYGSGAFVISGGATLSGGTFEPSSNFDLGPSTNWVDISVSFTGNPLEFVDTLPLSLLDREPVIDTGAGNPDGMVLMERLTL
ncbi:PKD domain-containing protein [bacterium]|nr:PKD domain-containing protein [bacterium]